MDKQKTNLEVAKFKLEWFLVLLAANRDEEAIELFNQSLSLINVEIKKQEEAA